MHVLQTVSLYLSESFNLDMMATYFSGEASLKHSCERNGKTLG